MCSCNWSACWNLRAHRGHESLPGAENGREDTEALSDCTEWLVRDVGDEEGGGWLVAGVDDISLSWGPRDTR